MEQSRREISTLFFGKKYPREKDYWGRASVDFIPLLLNLRDDAVIFIPHVEKFLPGNVSLSASAELARDWPYKQSFYALYGGPRRYFLGDHARFFLGIEPYVGREFEYFGYAKRELTYTYVALPATFGYLWQGRRLFTSLHLGAGPGYAWVERNDLSVTGGFGRLVIGSLSTGLMF